MAPAFRDRRDAIGFLAFLVVLLALPILLSWVGLPSRKQVWSGVPTALGPVGDLVHTLYEEKEDADVLFLGTSPLRAGLLPGEAERYFSAKLGRPARIRTLAMWWQSLDLQYVMLDEYLRSHRPKLIVFELPAAKSATSAPHRQLFRWLRYGEYGDELAGLPPRDRTAIYAEQVLGGPRQALNLLRPNLLGPDERSAKATEASSSRFRRAGYGGAPYVPDTMSVNSLASAATLRSVLAPEISMQPGPAGKGEYLLHFFRRIVDLAKSKDVPLVFIAFPEISEFGRSDVPQVVPLADLAGSDAQIVAVPLGALLWGLPPERVPNFFFDDHHLNQNGAKIFGQTVMPAIYKAYERATRRER